jgi:hypothetical protein
MSTLYAMIDWFVIAFITRGLIVVEYTEAVAIRTVRDVEYSSDKLFDTY